MPKAGDKWKHAQHHQPHWYKEAVIPAQGAVDPQILMMRSGTKIGQHTQYHASNTNGFQEPTQHLSNVRANPRETLTLVAGPSTAHTVKAVAVTPEPEPHENRLQSMQTSFKVVTAYNPTNTAAIHDGQVAVSTLLNTTGVEDLRRPYELQTMAPAAPSDPQHTFQEVSTHSYPVALERAPSRPLMPSVASTPPQPPEAGPVNLNDSTKPVNPAIPMTITSKLFNVSANSTQEPRTNTSANVAKRVASHNGSIMVPAAARTRTATSASQPRSMAPLPNIPVHCTSHSQSMQPEHTPLPQREATASVKPMRSQTTKNGVDAGSSKGPTARQILFRHAEPKVPTRTSPAPAAPALQAAGASPVPTLLPAAANAQGTTIFAEPSPRFWDDETLQLYCRDFNPAAWPGWLHWFHPEAFLQHFRDSPSESPSDPQYALALEHYKKEHAAKMRQWTHELYGGRIELHPDAHFLGHDDEDSLHKRCIAHIRKKNLGPLDQLRVWQYYRESKKRPAEQGVETLKYVKLEQICGPPHPATL